MALQATHEDENGRPGAATVSASVNDSCTNPAGIPSTLRERGVFQQPWRRPQL